MVYALGLGPSPARVASSSLALPTGLERPPSIPVLHYFL